MGGEVARALRSAVEKCGLCRCVDKPVVKYRAYEKWLPDRVRVLAVTESPPPSTSSSFFYNLATFDRLRLSLKTILGVRDMDDYEFLRLLRDKGVFITNAVKCRPLSRREIPAMRRRCTWVLKRELELLKPERIIAMGKTASASLSEVLNVRITEKVVYTLSYRLGGVELVVAPHPNYVFRFRRDLAGLVRAYLTC